MNNVVILGSTGSIGVNTLEVVRLHPGQYRVFALTASTNVNALFTQCRNFQPQFAVMADAASAKDLQERCAAAGLTVQVLAGAKAIAEMAAHPDADVVMAAIVGAAGLAPCMEAARSGKRLLLANKEALVVGGQLFMDAVKAGGATLLPIDSEHSAVFQSLPHDRSSWGALVDKIILTASGGPFRTRSPQTLGSVTPEQACAHPNWVMGRKISVDSATMMNKALEVIEAKFLFGMEPAQIEVVIHPQSVIHSMVQFVDHSVVAQLGTPDMRGPIAYGLAWPQRIRSGASALDFTQMGALTFEPFTSHDHRQRYPGLQLAWQVLNAPQGSTAVLNAANEVAVDAFLHQRIAFDQIHVVNVETLARSRFSAPESLAALMELDQQSRALALAVIHGLRQ
ncbi:MAG: 1-deoxy-D-xylulose-5-phosphate reductoisomerase [Rhodoferax sp.]|nr:1-deoxy-D-xylulose-5-phosphate reductoisomerase [Rhodoferax sp.]